MFATGSHLPHQGACPRRSTVAEVATHLLPASSRTRKTGPSILNNSRPLFPASNPQPSHFQAPAHSFAHHKKLTLAFPISSPLFARSLTNVQHSTPLLSCAPALFVKNTREGVGGHRLRVRAVLAACASIITQSNAATSRPAQKSGPARQGVDLRAEVRTKAKVPGKGSLRGKQVKGSFGGKIDTSLHAPYPLETDTHSKPRANIAWTYSRKSLSFAPKASVE